MWQFSGFAYNPQNSVFYKNVFKAFCFFLFVLVFNFSTELLAAKTLPKELKNVGVNDRSGQSVDIESLKFQDETGKEVPLSSYFNQEKPVILTLVYYNCPNLCNYLLNGVVNSLRALEWTIGDEFEMVTVTINPKEKFALAAQKKEKYVNSYGRLKAKNGWHFLTGTEDQINSLAKQVGYGFKYDEKLGEYAHGSAIFVLTPEGKISRTLYGIEFEKKDLKLSLLEASDGKIGNVLDKVLLFCYGYDPDAKSYSFTIMKIMRFGGTGTLLVFGGYLTVFWTRQRKRKSKKQDDLS